MGRGAAGARAGKALTTTYDLFARAMANRKQILCMCDGYPREICPHILGQTKGQEMALAYQFGGQSKSGLPPGGEWRCLMLEKVRDVSLRDGHWYSRSVCGAAPFRSGPSSTSTRDVSTSQTRCYGAITSSRALIADKKQRFT